MLRYSPLTAVGNAPSPLFFLSPTPRVYNEYQQQLVPTFTRLEFSFVLYLRERLDEPRETKEGSPAVCVYTSRGIVANINISIHIHAAALPLFLPRSTADPFSPALHPAQDLPGTGSLRGYITGAETLDDAETSATVHREVNPRAGLGVGQLLVSAQRSRNKFHIRRSIMNNKDLSVFFILVHGRSRLSSRRCALVVVPGSSSPRILLTVTALKKRSVAARRFYERYRALVGGSITDSRISTLL